MHRPYFDGQSACENARDGRDRFHKPTSYLVEMCLSCIFFRFKDTCHWPLKFRATHAMHATRGTCVPYVACVASGWKLDLTDASHQTFHIFTMQHYAKRGICRRRVSVCLCVCLSVCPSHSGIVSKRLNVGSRK